MNIPYIHTIKPAHIAQTIRFVLSGVANVLVTLVVFWILLDVFNLFYMLASILTWLVGITVNFSFMWLWVFKKEELSDIFATYRRHFVFHAIYYLINLALLVLFTEATGAHPLIVQAVLLVFLLPINFFATKRLVIKVGQNK